MDLPQYTVVGIPTYKGRMGTHSRELDDYCILGHGLLGSLREPAREREVRVTVA